MNPRRSIRSPRQERVYLAPAVRFIESADAVDTDPLSALRLGQGHGWNNLSDHESGAVGEAYMDITVTLDFHQRDRAANVNVRVPRRRHLRHCDRMERDRQQEQERDHRPPPHMYSPSAVPIASTNRDHLPGFFGSGFFLSVISMSSTATLSRQRDGRRN